MGVWWEGGFLRDAPDDQSTCSAQRSGKSGIDRVQQSDPPPSLTPICGQQSGFFGGVEVTPSAAAAGAAGVQHQQINILRDSCIHTIPGSQLHWMIWMETRKRKIPPYGGRRHEHDHLFI